MSNTKFSTIFSILVMGLILSSELVGIEKVRIRIPVDSINHRQLHNLGFIVDHKKDRSFIYGYIDPEKLSQVRGKLGTRLEILGLDLPVSRSLFAGYHDYDALTDELKKLAKDYPDLVHLSTAGKSVEGRELWYLILSDNPSLDESEPKLIYIANMHGDEVVGRELMLYLVKYLLEEYGKDARATNLLDNAQVFIMPSMNPDGFESGRRWNANGADLNRDFPDHINDPNNSPEGREVETANIMALVEKHHFLTSINWHGGALCMNLPWDGRSNSDPSKKFGDDPFLYKASAEYAKLNPPMYQNNYGNFENGVTYGYEWYPIYGGIQDYFSVYGRSIMATGEISNSKWPSSSQLPDFWKDNQQAMLMFFYRSMKGVHLYITDSDGNDINNVTVTVSTAPNRSLVYDGPYINKPTLPGQQLVTIEAQGFESITITMDSETFSGTYRNLSLWKRN